MLPLLRYRDQIRESLARRKKLIVTALPGTGKSTQVPQFFIDECTPQKKILVLEPRRIAARSLACRVAEERGCTLGGEVGYQVRFERKASDETRLLFLTYGTFVQLLQSDPVAVSSSIIVFDEFHERSLDADVALAWVLKLAQSVRNDLSLMVLSATLETVPLQKYLDGCPVLAIPDQAFPVAVRYQPPQPQEALHKQVERAVSGLFLDSNLGSILVFLPGLYEIERAAEAMYEQCRRRGYRLMQLHGGMTLAGQQEVLRLPAGEPCVILATNVAETSLTVPGVTAVVDSGLARVASYDHERDRNTLYLGRISLQNAAQRAGRAGRLTKGVCVRLWSRDDERAMPAALSPEFVRLNLTRSMLALCRLEAELSRDSAPRSIRFLTPPSEERWIGAHDELARCGAFALPESTAKMDAETASMPLFPLSKLGDRMARLPIEPTVAAVLLQSRSPEERAMNAAMAALWENSAAAGRESNDLFDMAGKFLADKAWNGWGREVGETYGQLERLLPDNRHGAKVADVKDQPLKTGVTKTWMRIFRHRIGVREKEGSVYTLSDGRSARIVVKTGGDAELPRLMVALAVHERAGRDQKKQVTVPLYLPLEEEWIAEEFPDLLQVAVECRWDETKERVVLEKTSRFAGAACSREELPVKGKYREMASACLVKKLCEGIWEWKKDEPAAEQFVYRLKLVAASFPEANVPSLTGDDWELVYHELCEDRSSLDEIKKISMLSAIKAYIGPHHVRFVEKKAPDFVVLRSGKRGKVAYFDAAPPELSARLGDLIGYQPRFLLMDGRVQGVFNILAPNFRTVQKTLDLGSFWQTAYPSIKKELQRKYPKHPWP
jgi:ATP-dependent helicase HrpB